MRLLNTRTGQFVWTNSSRDVNYAILSHVWDKGGEQSLQDVQKIMQAACETSDGSVTVASILQLSEKLRKCCEVALADDFELVWIDSCCIDKTSSAELSEALNSMYGWYQDAAICYSYLADIDSADDPRSADSQFRKSRWFTRGWTLQELIAPSCLVFVSKDWHPIGTKTSLALTIAQITGVDRKILTHEAALDTVSVARRMSWASQRETTRLEDHAYSLFGIFQVNMPTIYGEGYDAFRRLQEEILKKVPDQSIFTWGHRFRPGMPLQYGSDATWQWGLLAKTLDDFRHCSTINALSHRALTERLQVDIPLPEYTMTSYGIRTTLPIIPIADLLTSDAPQPFAPDFLCLAILACEDGNGDLIALLLCNHTNPLAERGFVVGLDVKSSSLLPRHVRITSVPKKMIDARRESISIRDIHINPHRDPPQASMANRLLDSTLAFLADNSSCDVLLLRTWCLPILEQQEYTISRDELREPERPLTHVFTMRHSGEVDPIIIRVGPCPCDLNFLAATVQASGVLPAQDIASVEPMSHPTLHPSHVYAWTSGEDTAWKTYELQYASGAVRILRLTLSVRPGLDYSDPEKRYLSIEFLDAPVEIEAENALETNNDSDEEDSSEENTTHEGIGDSNRRAAEAQMP
jgi:hypothetical protein